MFLGGSQNDRNQANALKMCVKGQQGPHFKYNILDEHKRESYMKSLVMGVHEMC